MKKAVSILLALVIFLTLAGINGSIAVLSAQNGTVIEIVVNNPTAKVNGTNITLDQSATILNDRTLVPIRFIAESLGATVKWDETQMVTITMGSTTILIKVDSNVAKVNGTNVTLDQSAIVLNDRTMVPIRFIAENLGAAVDWDDFSQKVTIRTENPAASETVEPQSLQNDNPADSVEDIENPTEIIYVAYPPERFITCSQCNGSGKQKCMACGGDGIMFEGQHFPSEVLPGGFFIPEINIPDTICTNCGGTGTTKCSKCNGSGEMVNPEYKDYVKELINLSLSTSEATFKVDPSTGPADAYVTISQCINCHGTGIDPNINWPCALCSNTGCLLYYPSKPADGFVITLPLGGSPKNSTNNGSVNSGATDNTDIPQAKTKCIKCDGTGKIDCPSCHGSGKVEKSIYVPGLGISGAETDTTVEETCPACHGSGTITCTSCFGKGYY